MYHYTTFIFFVSLGTHISITCLLVKISMKIVFLSYILRRFLKENQLKEQQKVKRNKKIVETSS